MSIKGIPVSTTPAAVLEAPAENPEKYNSSLSPISTDALLTLIASMQQQLLTSQQNAAEANAQLAAAILKTTEPREIIKSKKDLAKEANDKMFDEQAREMAKRQKENITQVRDNCVHIAGCSELSEQRDIAGRTSIIWHRNDAQVDVGICSVCQRIFHPDDKVDSTGRSYQFWRKQPSFNKISASGFRSFMDPNKARSESYLHDS